MQGDESFLDDVELIDFEDVAVPFEEVSGIDDIIQPIPNVDVAQVELPEDTTQDLLNLGYTTIEELDLEEFFNTGELSGEILDSFEEIIFDQDTEVDKISDLRNQVLELQFDINDSMDEAELKQLIARGRLINKALPAEKLLAELTYTASDVRNNLASSAGLFGDKDEYSVDIESIIHNHSSSNSLEAPVLSAMTAIFSKIAENSSRLLNSTPSDIVSINRSIMEGICAQYPVYNNDTDGVLLESYLGEITVRIIQNFKKYSKLETDKDKTKKRIASYLLQEELDKLKNLVEYLKDGYSVIKQIILKPDGTYTACCGVCGSYFPLDGVMMEVFYYVYKQRSIDTLNIPSVKRCECGRPHLLLHTDYAQAVKLLNKEHNEVLSMFVENSKDFSQGTPIMKLNIGIKHLAGYLSDITFIRQDEVEFTDLTFEEVDLDELDIDVNYEQVEELELPAIEFTERAIDSLEFKDAVDTFYNKLKIIQLKESQEITKSSTGVVDHASLAYYVANVLGKDYDNYRNQALMSLMVYIDENPFLHESLNMEEYWRLKTYSILAANSGSNLELIDRSTRILLINWYSNFTGESTVEVEDFSTILDKIRTVKVDIDNRISELEMLKEDAMSLISDNIEELGHVPILNISSYNVKDFRNIVSCIEIEELLNSIVDRMILNNLAYDFFEIWRTYDIISKRTLRDSVIENTDPGTSYTKLRSALTDKKNLKFAYIRHNYLESIQKLVMRQTVFDLEPIANIYKSIKVSDFYSAVKGAYDLVSDSQLLSKCNLVLYKDQTSVITQCLKELAANYNSIKDKSIEEYYLKDFSKEELQDNEEVVNSIEFGRYIPKREVGEDLVTYVNRYKSLQLSAKLNDVPCYDNWVLFMPHMYAIGIISMSLTIFEAGYSRYSETMFMSVTLNYCADDTYYFNVNSLLGTTDEIMLGSLVRFKGIQKPDYNSELAELYNRLGNIPFDTSIEVPIKEWYSEYSKQIMFISENLNEKLKEYDPELLLSELCNRPEEAFVYPNSKIELEPDKYDSLSEIYAYFKDNRFVAKIVEGEV